MRDKVATLVRDVARVYPRRVHAAPAAASLASVRPLATKWELGRSRLFPGPDSHVGHWFQAGTVRWSSSWGQGQGTKDESTSRAADESKTEKLVLPSCGFPYFAP
jgi:hypothetical protein